MVLIFLFLFLISINSDVTQMFHHPQTHTQCKPHKLQRDLLKTKWLSNVEMTEFVGGKDLHLTGRCKALNGKKVSLLQILHYFTNTVCSAWPWAGPDFRKKELAFVFTVL